MLSAGMERGYGFTAAQNVHSHVGETFYIQLTSISMWSIQDIMLSSLMEGREVVRSQLSFLSDSWNIFYL